MLSPEIIYTNVIRKWLINEWFGHTLASMVTQTNPEQSVQFTGFKDLGLVFIHNWYTLLYLLSPRYIENYMNMVHTAQRSRTATASTVFVPKSTKSTCNHRGRPPWCIIQSIYTPVWSIVKVSNLKACGVSFGECQEKSTVNCKFDCFLKSLLV